MTDRDTLIEKLAERFPNLWTKNGEDFGSGWGSNSIWTGEGSTFTQHFEGEKFETDLFDYYSESDTYEFGVHKELAEFVDGHGYYVDCNDPGTYFILPA